MIKCIYIDGYNTIEDGSVFRDIEQTYFDDIATIIGCQKSDIQKHMEFFCENYGDFVWEYHEIFWRSLVKRFCTSFDEALVDRVYSQFLDFYESEVCLFDGTLNTLNELSKSVSLVLVANGNSRRLKRLIKKYDFQNIFTDYVISSETPYQKPDKFMFQYGLKMYGWKPQEVLMVGDKYDNDILGAKKCGLLTAIFISKSKAPSNYELVPDFMINSISELKDIVSMSKKNNISIIPDISTTCKEESRSISAFIVAGGKGSRLGNLGLNTQKCMLELWGKPILYYTILSLKNAGCSRIVIAINHLSEQIIDYFGDGSSLGVNIIYVKKETKSTYDALFQSLQLLTERILYVHGNILFQNKLLENIIRYGNQQDNSVIASVESKITEVRHAQFETDKNGNISRIDLTERDGVMSYTFLGVAYYKKQDFVNNLDYDEEGKVDVSGMVEKVIQQKLDKGLLTLAYQYRGGWRHIESEDDYLEISKQNRWDIYYEK
ncbi:HAD-IA family hydrolase [Blautia schinkii]|nr:HAD-IA family hydrolase [Blautia schinkii]